ncbi:SDR family oxidoreductase [Massilia antarctica]|uniref:SDR family oxidoreductase n=1 Tax=Massilia antarctica TaxID=2765360 RepID=UPI0006BB5BBB|nr:SDR family oxidoreductase [Massilia sp. H27-R4]MCY0916054.1 SDR family oxidoreductase [Massilia sp. H27-R4]CUI08371.1 3-oxoacyl-[acyl-carrier protein] reductase [Janthinobacterium sp. CG23_2]CUU32157.1 3-oxoacyl-[acyl-carrier protein] reductase [Janthinobacterium sp. CG23_2]
MGILANKTAIVTGASSGIGYEAAKLFASEGANVVVVARRGEKLDQLVSEIVAAGGKAVALVGDVKNESVAKKAVELAKEHFGGLDIAFNNAGTLGAMGDLADVTAEGWKDTIDTNLTSAFFCAKHQLPALVKSGSASLIFTSSFVGHSIGLPGMAAYATSKAGLVGLARTLAAEYSAKGVRVNALMPGGTDTEMGEAATSSPEARAFVEGIHAMKRLALPGEIAKAALFLASDASSFVTGSTFFVDGGVTMTKT